MENKNQKPLSLYAMWLEAYKKGELPPEWRLAHNFLTWATANGYRTEYGYKGEFMPENLLEAIKTTRYIGQKEIAEIFKIPAELLDGSNAELAAFMEVNGIGQTQVNDLVNNNTLAALKELAKGIDLGKATKKEDIARLIVAAGASSGITMGADEAKLLVEAGASAGSTIGSDEPEVSEDAGE